MGRFSDAFKTGYNKEVIEKAKLKKGDEVTIEALYTNASAFWSLESDGITAAQDSQRKYPKRFVFDESALDSAHTELLKSIGGIEPEIITIYSSNPEFYKRQEAVYDVYVSTMIEAGASIKTIADLPPLALSHTPVLIELKHPVEHVVAHHERIDERNYVHNQLSSLAHRTLKNYSLLGYLDNNPPSLPSTPHITVSTDKILRDVKTKLAGQYPLLNYFTAPHVDYSYDNDNDNDNDSWMVAGNLANAADLSIHRPC